MAKFSAVMTTLTHENSIEVKNTLIRGSLIKGNLYYLSFSSGVNRKMCEGTDEIPLRVTRL